MPEISENSIHDFLWSATSYPCSDFDYQQKQIREMVLRSGGNIEKAIELAHQDLDIAMTEYRKKVASGDIVE